GTDVRTWNLGGDPRPALATLSDDDGDGLPEIVFAASDFIAIESSLGGRILWRTDANGAWGYSAAARTADFDGDGRDDFVLGIDTDSTNFVDEGRAELRTANRFWLDILPNHDIGPYDYLYLRANLG